MPADEVTRGRSREPWFRRGAWFYDGVAVVVTPEDHMTFEEAARALGRGTIFVSVRLHGGELSPAVLGERGGPIGVTRASVELAAQRWRDASPVQRAGWRLKALVRLMFWA